MKLYSGPLSLFSRKVEIALHEKGLPFDRLIVAFSQESGYSPKHPDVLAVNPKGQVPVLVDGELSLYDSTIILEYLDERVPKAPLFPTGAAERARCRMLEDLGDTLLAPNLGVLVREVLLKPDASTRDSAAVAQTKAELARQYQRLERELGKRDYLCGEFSVADISCFSPINIASLMEGAPSAELGNLAKWLSRMSKRPSVARYLAEFSEATAPLRAPAQAASAHA